MISLTMAEKGLTAGVSPARLVAVETARGGGGGCCPEMFWATWGMTPEDVGGFCWTEEV